MMKLKLNDAYQNDFITLHNGLILKKGEDWKEYSGKLNTELQQYIHQRYIIVQKEEVKTEAKIEEKPKVEEKVEIKAEVKPETTEYKQPKKSESISGKMPEVEKKF